MGEGVGMTLTPQIPPKSPQGQLLPWQGGLWEACGASYGVICGVWGLSMGHGDLWGREWGDTDPPNFSPNPFQILPVVTMESVMGWAGGIYGAGGGHLWGRLWRSPQPPPSPPVVTPPTLRS